MLLVKIFPTSVYTEAKFKRTVFVLRLLLLNSVWKYNEINFIGLTSELVRTPAITKRLLFSDKPDR